MENKIDLNTYDIKTLKSLAYDMLIQIEQLQRNLQVVNQAIMEKSKEGTPIETPDAKEEKK